ncbi:MAG: lysozyme inhibitor LprI family protein [Pseudomonadota bacterium]
MRCLLASVFLLLCITAGSAENDVEQALQELQTALAASDDELNSVWQALREAFNTPDVDRPPRSPDAWETALAAQRAWISFRDAQCEAEATAFNEEAMEPLVRLSCLQVMTDERTEQLKSLMRLH